MVVILHGDNQVASRRRLSAIREHYQDKGWEIMNAAKSVSLEEINLSSNAQTLLGVGTIVVVEEFWSGKKKAAPTEISGNVIFWEGRELPKILLNSLPKSWKVENFPITQVTFKFLDTLTHSNPQISLRILHDIQNEDAYSLLPLIAWHARHLIWAKEAPNTLNFPSWRAQKLNSQASKFELEGLYKFHEQLLALDKSIKTGTNVLPPLASLELLIANL